LDSSGRNGGFIKKQFVCSPFFCGEEEYHSNFQNHVFWNRTICFMDLLDIASVASSLSSLREGYVKKHEACWVLFFLLPSP
jgi:hypothetical protein